MPALCRPLPPSLLPRQITRIELQPRMLQMTQRAANTVAAAGAAATLPSPSAYVYSGPGAGTRSVLSTLHSLSEALVPAVQVGWDGVLATRGTAAILEKRSGHSRSTTCGLPRHTC